MEDDDEEDEDDGDSEPSSENSDFVDKEGISSSPKASKSGRRKLYTKSRKKSQTNSPLGTPKIEERVPPITTGTESDEEGKENELCSPQRRPSRPTRKKGVKNKPKAMSPAQNSMVASTSELFPEMSLEKNEMKKSYFEKNVNQPTSSLPTGLVSYLRVNEGDDIFSYKSKTHANSNDKFRRVASAVARSFSHSFYAHDDMGPMYDLDTLIKHTDTNTRYPNPRTQSSPPNFSFHQISQTRNLPSQFVPPQLVPRQSIYSDVHCNLETMIRNDVKSVSKIDLKFDDHFTKETKNIESTRPQLMAMGNGSLSLGACLRRSSLHGTPQRYIASQSRRCSLLSTPIRYRTSYTSIENNSRPFSSISPTQNQGRDEETLYFRPKSIPLSAMTHYRTNEAKTNQQVINASTFAHTAASFSSASAKKLRRSNSVKRFASLSPTRKQNTDISKLLFYKGRIDSQGVSRKEAVLESDSKTNSTKTNKERDSSSQRTNNSKLEESTFQNKRDKSVSSPKKVSRTKLMAPKGPQNLDKRKNNEEVSKKNIKARAQEEINELKMETNDKKKSKIQNAKINNAKPLTKTKTGNPGNPSSTQNIKSNIRNVKNKANETLKLSSSTTNNKTKRNTSPPKSNLKKSDNIRPKQLPPEESIVTSSNNFQGATSDSEEAPKTTMFQMEGDNIDNDPETIIVNQGIEDGFDLNDGPSNIFNSQSEEGENVFNGDPQSPPTGGSPGLSRKGRRKSSLKDLMGDAADFSKFQNQKRKSKSVGQMNSTLLEEENEDEFNEELPDFAKSYVLSKKGMMKTRARLHTVSEYGTDEPNDVYNNPAVSEAFKFEMLKASLDYDGGISSGDKLEAIGKPRRGTRTSFGNAVADIDTSGFNDFDSGRTTRTGMSRMSNKHSSWNEGKRAKNKKKKSRDAPGANLVPCTGPGTLADYGEYLKAGGFVPLPVMDAEEGVRKGTFALNKPVKDEYDIESEWGIPNQGNAMATLDFAELSIQRQFDSINEKFSLPEDDKLITEQEKGAVNALKSLGFVPDEKSDDKVDLLSGKGDSLLDDVSKTKAKKKPRRESLAKRTASTAKKNPKRKSNTDDLLLFGDDDDAPNDEPTNNVNSSAADSGYSSARKSSVGAPVSSGSTLPPIIGESRTGSDDDDSIMVLAEDDPDLKAYRDELKEQRLLDDALKGQNLLGMMLEDKPKYGHNSGEADSAESKVEGVDAIDLFLDPMSVFGGERHPALQEVLKQMEKQKDKRGEELAKLKVIAKELKQQRGMVGRLRGMV
jgi:hypothetical protein